MDLSTLGRFHIAPGGDPASPETWIWEDRSADVNHTSSPAVRITGGRGDEVGNVEAGSCHLEVDNAGGHYCVDNPLGRWYGELALGCPARWGTISGAESFAATTSGNWGAPDVGTSWSHEGVNWASASGIGTWASNSANTAAAATLIGADARNGNATFTASVPVVATGSSMRSSLLARRSGPSSTLLFSLNWGTGGTLTAEIRRDHAGSLTTLSSAAVGSYSAGQRFTAECEWDGQDLRLRVWATAGTKPTTWTTTATDTQCTGSLVGLHGARNSGNTNASPVVFSFDDFEVLAVEFVGTVPEWPVRWDPTAQVSWSPIEIAGIVRDLGQGDDDVQSPIFGQLVAQKATGYWPLEDGAGALVAASGLPAGNAASVTDGEFGSSDCPAGASSALMLKTAGISRLAGRGRGWPVPQDGYAAMCYARFPSLPASSAPVAGQRLMDVAASGTVVRWVVYATSTGFYVEGYKADDTLQVNVGSFSYVIDPTKWFAIQLEAEEVGATVNWSLIWHQVGATSFIAGSGSYSGTANLCTAGVLFAPVDGTLVSNFWLGDDDLPFVDGTFQLVSAGYAGESATARIARLAAQQGVQIAIEDGDSELLGPQKPGRFLDLVRTAEAADMGILYEAGAGLGYRPRGARYNRPVSMALAMAADGDIADDPQPTKNDQRTRNQWTVSRDSGSSATASDEEHVAKSRRRSDSTTIAVFTDGVLLDHASWRVHLGTWGEYRWPQLVLDLTDRPTALASWRGRLFAPRITVTGVPAQGPIGQDLDLIVEGFSQEISSDRWRVTLNCSPARQWDVGFYGTGTAADPSWDSATSRLAEDLTTTETIWDTEADDPNDCWHTDLVGQRVIVGGEVCQVTAVGAVSGSGPYTQQITCTRSVNGIVKTHSTGARIELAPGYYARWAL